MKKYIPILQEYGKKGPFYFEKFVEHKGLTLTLRDSNNVVIDVFFDNVRCYRRAEETDIMTTLLEEFGSDGATKTFYLFTDSAFKRWFNEQNYNVWITSSLAHYAIITEDDIFDVLAFDEPLIFSR